MGRVPEPPSSGRDCPSVPANIYHAASSRLSRMRGELSPPSSRVGAATDPDLTLDTASKSWLSGAAGGPLSAVPESGLPPSPTLIFQRDRTRFTPQVTAPHSPVSGRFSVTSGSSLTGISSRLGRRSRSSSLLYAPICIWARAVNSPLRARANVAWCRLAINRPSAVVVSGGSRKYSSRSWRADLLSA